MNTDKYQVFDQTDRHIHVKGWPNHWTSFEDAEYDLDVFLGDKYETDR